MTARLDPTGAEYAPPDEGPLFARPAHRDRIEREFAEFHARNPQIFEDLLDMAIAEKAAGEARGSIARLYEVLRHERILVDRAGAFTLNNDYRALYARLLMEQEPTLRGWFEIRERRAT